MAIKTEWTQLEPSGFGNEAFGNPSDEEDGLKIHRRGFGTPKTEWTEYEE